MTEMVIFKDRTICFKSTPRIYRKEFFGLKCNTIRNFNGEQGDDRKKALDSFIEGYYNLVVCIVNTATGECFDRRVTDVTKWEDWYIISWEHNKE